MIEGRNQGFDWGMFPILPVDEADDQDYTLSSPVPRLCRSTQSLRLMLMWLPTTSSLMLMDVSISSGYEGGRLTN